jgi:hypothetical protein
MAEEKLLKAMLRRLLRQERVVLCEQSRTALRHGNHCCLLPLRYLPSGLNVRLQPLQQILQINMKFLSLNIKKFKPEVNTLIIRESSFYVGIIQMPH